MICLGIESTAHTLGIGVMDGKKITANERKMFFENGIHPRKTADHHAKIFDEVLDAALNKANTRLQDIDRVAFSQGPGIGPCLRVSAIGARTIGLLFKKPIYGVNHCVAHIEISKFMTKLADPLIVYVSGGNTQIIVKEGNRYSVIGETLDIGLGNMLDNFAREIGVNGAREIEMLASKGKEYVLLPYTVKGMDMSFTGLLTDAVKRVNKVSKEDLCHSLQETAYSMVCEASERALALTKKKSVIVCGGVAQNKRLQEMLKIMAADWGCKFGVAANEFNADNGAMIAYTASIMKKTKRLPVGKCMPIQKYRTDQFVF